MQFKLLVPHTHPRDQQYLDAGTIVGDGTPYPWVNHRGQPVEPSLGMVGMDEESQAHIDRHYNEEIRNDPLLPKMQSENTIDKAVEDLSINRSNPNVSPQAAPGNPPRNETTVDPLRGAPKGALTGEPAQAPQGGRAPRDNPLANLGASPQKG